MLKQKIIQHFKKNDPKIYLLIKKYDLPVVKSKSQNDYFWHLARSIIFQQLSGRVGEVIANRFLSLFPNNIAEPEKLIKLDAEKIRKAGISYSKISYLKDLAKRTVSGEINLKKISRLKDQDVIDHLIIVKGIGQWTAEMFLMFSLGRMDVFSTGDLGLKNAIKRLYGLEEISKEGMEQISLKWSPYRTHASFLLWKSLDA